MIETAFYTDVHLRQSTGPLLDKIRRMAMRRGLSGLKDMCYHFNVKLGATAQGAKEVKLNQDDFKEQLKNFGVLLSMTEHNLLCLAFKDEIGYVCVSTFVETSCGCLTKIRQDVVDRAFAKVDRDGSGVLDLDDMRGFYDAENHPKVINGSMTEDMVIAEFLDVFESEDSRDGKVTKEEWNTYYGAMSLSVPSDDYFIEVVTNAWKLGQPEPPKKSKAFLPEASAPSKFGGALGDGAGTNAAAMTRTGGADGAAPVAKRIAGYTGHLPNAQERHGETFSQVEASVKRSAPKKNAWLQGTYQDDANAFVRKGGKANAHSFKMA